MLLTFVNLHRHCDTLILEDGSQWRQCARTRFTVKLCLCVLEAASVMQRVSDEVWAPSVRRASLLYGERWNVLPGFRDLPLWKKAWCLHVTCWAHPIVPTLRPASQTNAAFWRGERIQSISCCHHHAFHPLAIGILCGERVKNIPETFFHSFHSFFLLLLKITSFQNQS